MEVSHTMDDLLKAIYAAAPGGNQEEVPSAQELLPNGKKTRGRVKVDMAYIKNKSRRLTSYSKRKHGIFKKMAELNTLTGAQCMLVVASETGQVNTYASSKFEGFMKREGKQIITNCLAAPDPETGRLPEFEKLTFGPLNSALVKPRWPSYAGTPITDSPVQFSFDSAPQTTPPDGSDSSDDDFDPVEIDSEPLNLVKNESKKDENACPIEQLQNPFGEAASAFMKYKDFCLVNSTGTWIPPKE